MPFSDDWEMQSVEAETETSEPIPSSTATLGNPAAHIEHLMHGNPRVTGLSLNGATRYEPHHQPVLSLSTTPISTNPTHNPEDDIDTKGTDHQDASKLFHRDGEGSASGVPIVQVAGQPTGWAAMAEDIRRYDEDKIKDCRDDIDTLMTFAGLFSAAITAFLVESYQILLPNPANETLQVLQYIAQQNLLMQNHLIQTQGLPLNLVSPPSPSSPNPGSINALILVNVLWSASLISSLVAASFGMLVKQWLREYLAVNNPSPQARLRVRRSREPSLSAWRVFEIAGALPFLLQLALALFFAGVCIFTTSVHSTVGRTSTVLVLSWAFCFLTVTVLPAFFPQCPYKTTFLRGILKFVHTHLPTFLESSSDLDEKQITKDSSRDLEILIDVDALQADDELLGTTILESIGQFHRPQLASLGDFLKRVLNHRCQLVRKVGAENLSWPVNSDLQSLTDRGKKAMRDIIARYVCIDDMPVSAKLATEINVDKTVFSRLDREVSGPFDQICAFLMSPNLRPLSPACAQLLKERLRSNPVQPFAALIQQWHLRSEGQTRGCQREVLDTLRYLHGDLSFDFERTFKHFCTVMGVYHSYLRPESAQLGDQYGWIEVLSPDDIATTGAFLCDIITSELHQNGVTRIEHSHSIFRAASCAFYLKKYLLSRNAAPYAMHQEMSALLAVAFVAPNQVAARTIIDACVQQNEQFYIQALCPVLADTRGRLGESGLQLALSNFHALITKNFLPNTRGLSKYLKLCFIAICLAPPGPSNSGAASNGLQWTKLFTSFATIISESSRETDAASRRLLTEIGGSLSRACLSQLNAKNIDHTELTKALQDLPQEPPLAPGVRLHVDTPAPDLHVDTPAPWEFTEPLVRTGTVNILQQAVSQVRYLKDIPRRKTFNHGGAGVASTQASPASPAMPDRDRALLAVTP